MVAACRYAERGVHRALVTVSPTVSLRGSGATKEGSMRIVLAAALTLPLLLAKESEPVQRLDEAAAVFSEIMATPDKGIPHDLLGNAHCIVIVPGLKTGAFVVG